MLASSTRKQMIYTIHNVPVSLLIMYRRKTFTLYQDKKVSKEELNMVLLQKVDKQQVANALQRKATKAELSQFDGKLTAIAL